jgi:PIN domain nuclease of toxin-antitoxin system
MTYLLDNNTFICAALQTGNLGKESREIISNKDNEICISTVSFWEISLKVRIKKFEFENININDFPQRARDMDFTIIDLQENETITFHELPIKENHKDPFDRMLIWQAIIKNMTMISKDSLFEQYQKDGLKLIW